MSLVVFALDFDFICVGSRYIEARIQLRMCKITHLGNQTAEKRWPERATERVTERHVVLLIKTENDPHAREHPSFCKLNTPKTSQM